MHLIGKLRSLADSALTSMPVQHSSIPETEVLRKACSSVVTILWTRCYRNVEADLLRQELHSQKVAQLKDQPWVDSHDVQYNTIVNRRAD